MFCVCEMPHLKEISDSQIVLYICGVVSYLCQMLGSERCHGWREEL